MLAVTSTYWLGRVVWTGTIFRFELGYVSSYSIGFSSYSYSESSSSYS